MSIKILKKMYKETNEAEKDKSKLRDELLKYDQKVIVLKDANQMG